MHRSLLSAGLLLCSAVAIIGQNPALPFRDTAAEQAAVINELKKISQSVQTLSEGFSTYAAASRPVSNEKHQRLLLGLEMLVKSEQRVATFQKLQIDLVEKLNEHRNKIAQIDVELRPRSIDRSVAFEGTTETEELRDSRRQKLRGERTSLTNLMNQIQTTLNETIESLNEAQAQTYRLRRTILPAIERELLDQ